MRGRSPVCRRQQQRVDAGKGRPWNAVPAECGGCGMGYIIWHRRRLDALAKPCSLLLDVDDDDVHDCCSVCRRRRIVTRRRDIGPTRRSLWRSRTVKNSTVGFQEVSLDTYLFPSNYSESLSIIVRFFNLLFCQLMTLCSPISSPRVRELVCS